MKLKLQLIRNNEIVLELPLSPADWPKDELESAFSAIDGDFRRFSKIFDALSHETRLRMMRLLVENEDRTISFAGFMRDLDLNPKIVWENSKKLKEGGLLKKTGRGKYSCSELGQTAFIVMSLTLRHLIESLEEMERM